jgi:ABC-type nitrate/sulfonate/bicarbonate transport system permease component
MAWSEATTARTAITMESLRTQELPADELPAVPRPAELAGPRTRWSGLPLPRLVPLSDASLRVVPVLVVLVALGAWELGARGGLVSPLFYPAPSAIAAALVAMIENGLLARHLGASAARIGAGFVVGGGAGLLLGLAMGWWRRLQIALDPLVAAAHPVPRLAMLPLILLLFGIGETARIVVVAISCFFPMVINGMTGVRQIQALHFEVARSFGAGRLQMLVNVVLPGSLPAVAAGARLSLISAFKTTLGIELISADRGLGHLIWFSWESFDTRNLYATLVVIAIVGMVMSSALGRLVSSVRHGTPEAGR